MNVQSFSAGFSPESDFALTRQPEGQPAFGENHAFWISDSQVHLCLHLNTLDGLGAFDLRHGKLNLVLPNGRVLVHHEDGGPTTERRPASANLYFRCDEPFMRWTCGFRGTMRDASAERQIGGELHPGPVAVVEFDVTCESVAPAWVQGSLTPGGLGPVAAFIGGHRYEQLVRCRGRVRIDGQEIVLDGQGNRTHRRGVRAFGPMLGHCWGAGFFPSGKGFGFQIYPTADGGVLWEEGYVIEGGQLRAARVIRAPWLKSFHPAGERLVTELETGAGRMVIEGETLGASIFVMTPGRMAADDVIISQSWIRYEVAGETAYNMIERSLRRSEINK